MPQKRLTMSKLKEVLRLMPFETALAHAEGLEAANDKASYTAA